MVEPEPPYSPVLETAKAAPASEPMRSAAEIESKKPVPESKATAPVPEIKAATQHPYVSSQMERLWRGDEQVQQEVFASPSQPASAEPGIPAHSALIYPGVIPEVAHAAEEIRLKQTTWIPVPSSAERQHFFSSSSMPDPLSTESASSNRPAIIPQDTGSVTPLTDILKVTSKQPDNRAQVEEHLPGIWQTAPENTDPEAGKQRKEQAVPVHRTNRWGLFLFPLLIGVLSLAVVAISHLRAEQRQSPTPPQLQVRVTPGPKINLTPAPSLPTARPTAASPAPFVVLWNTDADRASGYPDQVWQVHGNNVYGKSRFMLSGSHVITNTFTGTVNKGHFNVMQVQVVQSPGGCKITITNTITGILSGLNAHGSSTYITGTNTCGPLFPRITLNWSGRIKR